MNRTVLSFAIAASACILTSATPAMAQWRNCATEGGVCRSPAGATVRYGANGVYNTRVSNGLIACNSQSFGGDPLYNVRKSCQFMAPGGAPSGGGTITVMGRNLGPSCTKLYRVHQTRPRPRAFALSANGSICHSAWSPQLGLAHAQATAMNGCRRRGQGCSVILSE